MLEATDSSYLMWLFVLLFPKPGWKSLSLPPRPFSSSWDPEIPPLSFTLHPEIASCHLDYVRIPTRTPSYTIITDRQRTLVRPTRVPDCHFSLYEPLWAPHNWFLWEVFSWCPPPLWLLQSFLSHFSRVPWAPPHVWLWVSASAPISYWMKPIIEILWHT